MLPASSAPAPCRALRRRRAAAPTRLAALGVAALLAASSAHPAAFVGCAVAGPLFGGRTARAAGTAASEEGVVALQRLESALEAELAATGAGSATGARRVDLARLLLLAKAAEGLALKEGAEEATRLTQKAVAESLSEFVGKKDYTLTDVTDEIKKRTSAAVKSLDDIYLEDIARWIEISGQSAVSSFTGKEDYSFGDISAEVSNRAKDAVLSFTGKSNYELGDITKEAVKRAAEGVKGFTGKEEYKFGDLTKAALGKIFGGGDDGNK